RELGIETVIVYSQADANSLPVLLADEAICVGPPASTESYLNIPNILTAAVMSGAQAIHPGYGFLSENARFAEMCEEHGITFVGPSPDSMRALGDKATARRVAREAGVPIVPGSDALPTLAEAREAAERIGYPVLLKASAGGGGRGMRVVREASELEGAYQSAGQEALTAFGNPEMYLEKYLDEFRHIEVQVMGDGRGNVVHLGERDCSVQRRLQKLIEESPSGLPDELRARIHASGVALAAHVKYAGAGTLEFLVDRDGNYYFIEMNTRIQVEHPVTELVTDTDLVQAQLRVAAGEGLPWSQDSLAIRGHSIECRINAEDPDKGFRPSAGKIESIHFPGGPGVRVDSHAYSGYSIPPNYDSLIAKLIVRAPDRPAAIARMRLALQEMVVEGVKTTIPFHLRVLDNAYFQRGIVYTNFIATRLDAPTPA
ncbi:MAG TPA: acetyl-CoA carboxylase biotin carboxylase subunit, partial [Deinococcales bacterium]|nr:acetyl-CoA carboxylase biotin carboxylase subunit [Deinococcales bacterium]